MRLTRLAPALALTVAVVLGPAGPASAHITQLNITSAGADYVNDEADAGGTITCTAGETFRISLRATQKVPGFFGKGTTSGTCTGSSQGWIVATQSAAGDLVCEHAFKVVVIASTFVQGVEDDQEKARLHFPGIC